MAANPDHLHGAFMYCIDFAKQMLEQRGAFHPFGASVSATGVVNAVGGWNGEEHPKPIELNQLLVAGLSAQAREGSISGAAITIDVNIPPQYECPLSDGIRIQLEGDEYSRYLYVPYTIQTKGFFSKKREVIMADPISVEIEPEIFKEA
jgi:hypothetical protein